MAKGAAKMPQDYYETLGVGRDATAKDIKQAYRRLARQHHPDVSRDDQGAEERFKAIQEAYGVLGDETKRQQYDRFGHGFEQLGAAGAGGFRRDGQEIRIDDLGGLFGGLFGGGGGIFGGERGRPGADAEVQVKVTLDEVLHGTVRDVSTLVEDACARCRGRGCSGCGGRGKTPRPVQLLGVRIPAGVQDDDVLRVRGKGGAGAGGAAGDLLLRVSVAEHPFFTRRGDDLEAEVPLSLAEAALGAEIQVPTLQGLRPLRVPPGTAGGQRFRVRGFGLPNRKTGTHGHLMVRAKVIVPLDLTPVEREAILAAAARGGDPRAGLWQPPQEG
ncbi:MAG: J domain-containing protein [Fimbriimonadaceae bacterium]|nr:J domain-containing protein [Fimbriimonadaceae bacterium]